MKSILMSIKPEWVEKILNGEKTIEVRKTRPKIDTPFKVYIYCSKGKSLSIPESNYRDKYNIFEGFNKDGTPYKVTTGDDSFMLYPLNSKVVAEFTCDYIDFLNVDISIDWIYAHLEQDACLTFEQMRNYLGQNLGYFWHISNLKIYDKPKYISELQQPCVDIYGYCPACKYGSVHYSEDVESYEEATDCEWICWHNVKKAPQSWCYVEELK